MSQITNDAAKYLQLPPYDGGSNFVCSDAWFYRNRAATYGEAAWRIELDRLRDKWAAHRQVFIESESALHGEGGSV